MNFEEMLVQTEKWMEDVFSHEPTGHDIWHMRRVKKLAEHLARLEGGNLFICQMTALLHDYPDEKWNDDPDQAYQDIIRFLRNLQLSTNRIDQILLSMKNISYRGNHRVPETLEGRIVQDADRLDAMGAIGIARTFAYGGKKGQLIHHPAVPLHQLSNVEYGSNDTTIQHFYDKLLKLPKLLNTESARAIAIKRHEFMKSFLAQFYREWDGEDYQPL
ncbi:uncharacterized protein EDD68_10368 [Melghiribacillus thermohalophilus]|uniref:HD/PDEase domain-containing protein n=1 Tax=Melghiribacillus thermohalophilus TaxID=1324956 RepID=A0A4V2V2K8_9BACI|nr:HD domain-containing protein [Melghiribacillus thermohalophilus]TCT25515.1 uncharacterized protein EDD68_10368 [Melghiribacillus thermohalophilus]